MYHTIIYKSAWVNDSWSVGETYNSAKEANQAMDALGTSDAKDSFYNMRIMRHRKHIAKMTNWDSFTVTFNDGTIAGVNLL